MVRASPTPTMTSSSERQRPKIAAMETGPGPAKYLLPGACGSHDPSRKGSPSFSFGCRTKQSSSLSSPVRSPGPVYLVSPSVTRTGTSGTPAFSVYGRPLSRSSAKSPGPAAYHVGKVVATREATPPAYSFGRKLDLPHAMGKSPPPNTYNLPCLVGSATVGKKSSPAYTMTRRPNRGGISDDLSKTPGPGTYVVVSPQVYVQGSPTYSILGRNFPPSDTTRKPPPGTYSPEKVVVNRKEPPSYSFGIKHSEYIAPVLSSVI